MARHVRAACKICPTIPDARGQDDGHRRTDQVGEPEIRSVSREEACVRATLSAP